MRPEIGFKGFTDDWEQRKFSDIASRESTAQESSSTLPSIEYEDIISEEGILNKDIRNKEGRKQGIYFDGSQVLYGKLRPYLHNWINPDFAGVAVGDWWVLRPNNVEKSFLYRLIQTHKFDDIANQSAGSKMPRADWNLISNSEFEIPASLEEQSQIGQYFSNLDYLITLHQRKYERLVNVKRSMLVKMFPQNGSKVPEIRFKGFTDDWEQRKLGDVIEKLTGGASIAPDDYIDVGYRTIPKGAVNSSGVADMSGCKNVSEDFFEKNISSKTSSGELVTSLRDLVPTAPNMGRIVRICGETEDFLMPQGVYSIIVKEKNSEDFLITYSNSPEYRKIIMAEKNGSTQVHIRNGEFLNIDIPLPSYEEQMKIGEHFKTLDRLITLHQRKIKKLQDAKKAFLTKMFA